MRMSIVQRLLVTLAGLALSAGAAAGPLGAQSPLDRLSIHGFLSQAYAATDTGQLYGIPASGTSDYRTAALQFRYDVADATNVTIQLAHERLGRSRLQESIPDVALDWAYVEHRFSDLLSVKAGRVQIPVGIYNEVRDVGTVLPLYAPPALIYREGIFGAEAVDGIVTGHRVGFGRWSVDANLYYGGWDFLAIDRETRGRVRDGLGAFAWLDTPLDGVRVGGGVQRYTTTADVAGNPGRTQRGYSLFASADVTRDRYFVRGEWSGTRFTTRDSVRQTDAGRFDGFHLQAGVSPLRRVTLIGQFEAIDADYRLSSPFPIHLRKRAADDWAAGIRYAVRPDLVLKAEYHWNTGYLREDLRNDLVFGDPSDARYGIVSISSSF
jgi:hypothetical protein